MKAQILVPFRSHLYDVTISGNRIIHVTRISEDSGMEQDVKFEELSQQAQDVILIYINDYDSESTDCRA